MINDVKYKNISCVYKIVCKLNNKILIGSTTNLYNRIRHYINDIHKINPLKHYNKMFYEDIIKYGIINFDIEIIEQFNSISDIELKNKETYYMNQFNSLNLVYGYNIRQDIDGKYICSNSTREVKRKQTKEQWELGIRDNHSDKLKNYWSNNETRKLQQSKIMSRNKQKYIYDIYDENNNLIKSDIDYSNLYIDNTYNFQIVQKFCYVNRIANAKKITDSSYRNNVYVGKYRISRRKI